MRLQGQTHNWTRTNPGGGGAYSTIGASASGIIIAGSDLSGAYRSKNGGETWDIIGASNGLTETHVSGIGFHRIDGNILYIGTENGIFRSENGGNSVNQVLVSGYITDIEFGTNIATTGYATYHPEYDSNNGVIFKSTNNGKSWSQISTNLPTGIRILKIIVNPNDVNTLYILTGLGRFACGPADVFRSTDGGKNWTNLTDSLPEILDVAVDPNNTNNIYITTMNADCAAKYYWTDVLGKLYKSTDGGDTWNTPLSNYTGMIWIDSNDSNTIRLIDPREPYPWNNRSGTFTSTNGGTSFMNTGDVTNWGTFFNHSLFWSYGISPNGIAKTLGKDLSNPNNYYWVNSQWVFSTTDNGKTFNDIFTKEVSSGFWKSNGFDNINMMDISISQANPAIIYTAFFDIGIQRSLDKGESWQSCNDVAHSGDWDGFGGNSATILADPSRANVVWASLGGQQNGQPPTYLLKNINTGNKNDWVDVSSGLPNEEIIGLSIDEKSTPTSRTLYVTALKDVYKSTNDGTSWTSVFDCGGCRFTAVDQFNGEIVYAGGEKGLWRSMDGGISWTDVSENQMLATGQHGFWNRDYDGVFDIKTDPNNPNWVYVTVLGNNKGLFKSTDNGTTWSKILTDNYMRKVAIVPNNSNIIYATSSSAFQAGGYDSNSNGVLFSDDGGQTWTQQNKGMTYPFALAVAIDNSSIPTVFVGAPGTGFQKSLVPISPLSVEKTSKNTIKAYPNPFDEEFILFSSKYNANYTFSIFNSLGQEVKKFSTKTALRTNKQIHITLKNLESGVYLVKIKNNQYSQTIRMIKL